MKEYSVGIIFDHELKKVLLVLKNRPEHLKGTYNGPGGKFEDEDKDYFDCIVREVCEECALVTKKSDWKYCGVLNSSDRAVYFLTLVYSGFNEDAKKSTDEDIFWLDLNQLPNHLSNNMEWIIPWSFEIAKGAGDLKHFNAQIK